MVGKSTVIIDGKEYKEKHVATGYGSVSVEGSFENEEDIRMRCMTL